MDSKSETTPAEHHGNPFYMTEDEFRKLVQPANETQIQTHDDEALYCG